MKTFTISTALVALAALINAAPAPTARQFQAQITFEGATSEAFYTLSVPTDGSVFTICKSSRDPSFPPQIQLLTYNNVANPLSVSHISSQGGASCGFTGIDGSETTVVGAQTVDVEPPQAQVSGSCLAL